MAERRQMDVRSLIIGLLLGIVVLLAVALWRSPHRGHPRWHRASDGAVTEQAVDEVNLGKTDVPAPAMTFTVDATKVVPEGEGHFIETERTPEEIGKLRKLAEKTAGFDAGRGDEISVVAMRFDKSQQLQAREEAVAEERKLFWTGSSQRLSSSSSPFSSCAGSGGGISHRPCWSFSVSPTASLPC